MNKGELENIESSEFEQIEQILNVLRKRWFLLEEIRAGTTDRKQLQRKASGSRTTVYRGLEQLTDAGIVSKSQEGYTLTPFGVFLYQEFDQFIRALNTLLERQVIFQNNEIAEKLSSSVVSRSEIFITNSHAPYDLTKRIKSSIDSADALIGFAPAIYQLPSYLLANDQDNFNAEILLQEPAFKYLQENYNSKFDKLTTHRNISISKTSEPLSFGLLITKSPSKEIIILVPSNNGNLAALLKNDSDHAFRWAMNIYKKHKQHSKQ